MADRELKVKFWGHREENNILALALNLSIAALVVAAFNLLFLAAIPVIWVLRALAVRFLKKQISREEVVLSGGTLTVLEDGVPRDYVVFDEIAEIKAVRGGDGAILIDKEGRKLEIKSGGYGWQNVADEIAMRIGFKVNLEPQLVLSEPPKPKFVISVGYASFSVVLLAFVVIAFMTNNWMLPAIQLAIGAVSIGGLLFARRLEILSKRPDLYDPDVSGPMLKLSVESYAKLKGGNPPAMELEKGQEYVFLPSRRQFGRVIGLVGYPISLMGLLGSAYSLMWMLQSIFIDLGVPFSFLFVGLIAGIAAAFGGYAMAATSARGLKQVGDKIKVTEDSLILTRGKDTFVCSLNQRPKVVKSPYNTGLFYHYEVWTDSKNRKILIDRRFLWRSDRAMYEPESPWSDMWKGRVLPWEIPE